MNNKQHGRILLSVVSVAALVVAIICLLPIRPKPAAAVTAGMHIEKRIGTYWADATACAVGDTIRVGGIYAPGSTYQFFLDIPGRTSISLGSASAGPDGYIWLVVDPSVNPLPADYEGTCSFRNNYVIGNYVCGTYQCDPYSCNPHPCNCDWMGRCDTCYDVCYRTCPVYCPVYATADLTIDNTPPAVGSATVTPLMAAAGDRLDVVVSATDNQGVASVTADGESLTRNSDSIWYGNVAASTTVGTHKVTVVASDAVGNRATVFTTTYRTCRVMGMTARNATRLMLGSMAQTHLFKFWGTVDVLQPDRFTIMDGSGTPIQVFAPGYPSLAHGDYVSARGILDLGTMPITLRCSPAHVVKY